MSHHAANPVPAPALCAVILCLALTACRTDRKLAPDLTVPQGQLPSQAQVAEVKGPVQSRLPDGPWRAIREGDWIPMGGALRTPSESQATLRLYETGILVQVKPGTEVRLERLTYRREQGQMLTFTTLHLPRGEVAVDNANLSAGSEFLIRTPAGVTRVPPKL